MQLVRINYMVYSTENRVSPLVLGLMNVHSIFCLPVFFSGLGTRSPSVRFVWCTIRKTLSPAIHDSTFCEAANRILAWETLIPCIWFYLILFCSSLQNDQHRIIGVLFGFWMTEIQRHSIECLLIAPHHLTPIFINILYFQQGYFPLSSSVCSPMHLSRWSKKHIH